MHRRRGTSDTAATLRAHFSDSGFTPAQAEMVGVSARRLALATDAGTISRLRRGLYIAVQSPASRGVDSAQDVRVQSSDVASEDTYLAVASHRVNEFRQRGIPAAAGDETAASVWQLPRGAGTVPTICVPRGSPVYVGTRHGVRIREADIDDFRRDGTPTDRAEARHVVMFRGQFVTSALVTARDISRHLPRYQAVALFGMAQRRHAEWLLAGDERMDPGDLTEALADPGLRADVSRELCQLLQGSTRRLQWCASADPRPETYLEAISWGRFTGWGLGDMRPQAWVRGASGRCYRVDVLIDGIAGEADGAVKYSRDNVLWKEKLRQEDIENGGTPVVRWTYAEAEHRPDLLRERWRRALRRPAASRPTVIHAKGAVDVDNGRCADRRG